jgi:hypothetical protein
VTHRENFGNCGSADGLPVTRCYRHLTLGVPGGRIGHGRACRAATAADVPEVLPTGQQEPATTSPAPAAIGHKKGPENFPDLNSTASRISDRCNQAFTAPHTVTRSLNSTASRISDRCNAADATPAAPTASSPVCERWPAAARGVTYRVTVRPASVAGRISGPVGCVTCERWPVPTVITRHSRALNRKTRRARHFPRARRGDRNIRPIKGRNCR